MEVESRRRPIASLPPAFEAREVLRAVQAPLLVADAALRKADITILDLLQLCKAEGMIITPSSMFDNDIGCRQVKKDRHQVIECADPRA
jgi:hypothetical protein